MPAGSWTQAAAIVSNGCLSLRRAQDVAAPAFLASRIEARPYVRALFDGLGVVVADTAPLLEAYDAGIAAGRAELRAGLRRRANLRFAPWPTS